MGELKTLNTIERLQAVTQDERAGFLPTTHQELTSAITLLDYLGNPAYPGGVHQHLQEIYDHQIKYKTGRVLARISVVSVLHEYAGYMASANGSQKALRRVQSHLEGVFNPSLSLMESTTDAKQPKKVESDMVSLVRYLDLRSLARGKEPLTPFDPLATHINRSVKPAGANKQVEDFYTGNNRRQDVADYLAWRLETVTVGDVRQDIQPAAKDQDSRKRFWVGVLDGVRYTYRGEAQLAKRNAEYIGA